MGRIRSYTTYAAPERRKERRFRVPIELFANKLVIELLVLFMIVCGIANLMLHHSYFAVTDIAISGLDSYASAAALATTKSYLGDRSYGFIPHGSYIACSPEELEDALRHTLALDSITITKQFPHTLRIVASETPIRMEVEAPNGRAYISNDGLLVRWYPKEGNAAAPKLLGPVVRFPNDLTVSGVLQPIVSEELENIIVTLQASALRLAGRGLLAITLDPSMLDRITLQYEQGTEVIISGTTNIPLQLKKAVAALSYTKPNMQVDVRFADKIFVSAISPNIISEQRVGAATSTTDALAASSTVQR